MASERVNRANESMTHRECDTVDIAAAECNILRRTARGRKVPGDQPRLQSMKQKSRRRSHRTRQARVDVPVHTMQRYMPSASAAAADFLRRDSSRKEPVKTQNKKQYMCARTQCDNAPRARVSECLRSRKHTHRVSNFFCDGFYLFISQFFHAPSLQRT